MKPKLSKMVVSGLPKIPMSASRKVEALCDAQVKGDACCETRLGGGYAP